MLPRKSLGTITLYALTGGVLILLGQAQVLRLLGLSANRSSILPENSAALSSLLVGYGILLLALALLKYTRRPLTENGPGFWDSTRLIWRDTRSAVRKSLAPRRDAVWLLAIILVGLILRAFFLAEPMRFDESYTFLHFVRPGLRYLFDYRAPNNHVLHTILVQLSTSIWGSHPVPMRLPALLAGIASIPLTFILCRQLGQKRSGFVAAMGMSVAPYLVLYSSMARGYSLLVCLSLALALSAIYAAARPSLASCVLFASVAALGMLTIPSMLFPIAGMFVWVVCLLLIKGQTVATVLREFVIPSSVLLYALTLILYTPSLAVSGGAEPIVANEFILPSAWAGFWRQTLDHLSLTLFDYSRDVPSLGLLILIVLLCLGVAWTVKKRAWLAMLLLPSVLVGSVIVFLVKHSIPFARTWIYFIPFILVLVDWGFTWFIERFSKRIQTLSVFLALCLSCLFATSLMVNKVVATYPDTGYFPEAPAIAKHLAPTIACDDVIRFRAPADYPMMFYLWYYDVVENCAEPSADTGRKYFVVKKSTYAIEDMTDEPVTKTFDIGDAALYEALLPGKE